MTAYNADEIKSRLEKSGIQFRYTYEVIKGSGIYTNGRGPRNDDVYFKKLGVKFEDFRGKRVLEVGPFDGALSFRLEDEGAQVVAIDVLDANASGLALVHELRQST